MSDKNKRTTATTKMGNAPRDGQAFAIALKNISMQFSNLCGESEGFRDYDRLHNNENRLKSELEKKEQELNDMNDRHKEFQREIEKLKNEKDILKREFVSSGAEWKESVRYHTIDRDELSQLKPELETCRNKLKAATNENSQLSHDLVRFKESATKLERQCKIRDLELERRKLELENYRKDGEQLRSELGTIPIDDDMYAAPMPLVTNY
jgi:chromosome segregation ATPase